jgi:5-methylcytosine-specific restriction endonuclease McrA
LEGEAAEERRPVGNRDERTVRFRGGTGAFRHSCISGERIDRAVDLASKAKGRPRAAGEHDLRSPPLSVTTKKNTPDSFTMSDLLDTPIVLLLNRGWQPIGHRTVKQALVALCGGSDGIAPAVGLDLGYGTIPDGSWDFSHPVYLIPTPWDKWLELPIRPFDQVIATATRRIRVPTVVIATNYSRMPLRRPGLSRESIFERDGGICQYTGEFVGRDGGNLDHVVPRSRGGRDSFENLVWAKRSVNAAKSDRLPHEAGLRLRRAPKSPPAVPVSATLRVAKHRDWTHFLHPP